MRIVMRQNRFGMFLVTLVVLLLLGAVSVSGYRLKKKENAYLAREAELLSQIEAEKARAEEIEEFKKYTQTKKYVEEEAKDKLGLVYENEIIFKAAP